MHKSLFVTLCEIVAEFEGLTARMESGPIKAQLEDVIERFDAVIDRTIGLEAPAATHDA